MHMTFPSRKMRHMSRCVSQLCHALACVQALAGSPLPLASTVQIAWFWPTHTSTHHTSGILLAFCGPALASSPPPLVPGESSWLQPQQHTHVCPNTHLTSSIRCPSSSGLQSTTKALKLQPSAAALVSAAATMWEYANVMMTSPSVTCTGAIHRVMGCTGRGIPLSGAPQIK